MSNRIEYEDVFGALDIKSFGFTSLRERFVLDMDDAFVQHLTLDDLEKYVYGPENEKKAMRKRNRYECFRLQVNQRL